MFLNPNVYRTQIDLTATRILSKDFKTVYNDEYIIKASSNKELDYKIINEDEGGYVIVRILPKVKLLKEPDPSDGVKMINVVRYTEEDQSVNDIDNGYNYFFGIKKDAFKPLGKTLLSTKIIGVPLIQPVKLRPSKGAEGWSLGGEFTVSYNFGVRRKLGQNPFGQNFISIIPYGFGVGAAKYFKENIDGTLTEKKDAFAVTYYQGGILFTIQKVNFGVFAGFDAMIDKQNDWYHQGKPWLSFGLGYKFKTD